jgi:serine/threonine protein kinase
MDQERWKQIDAVFEQTLEVEPGERAVALARMCAGDDDLRQRVEALLEQEEPAQDFLKSSAIIGVVGELIEGFVALTPGRQISHYEIKERIGAGGMGEVWKARDEHLNRDVAIKVLPPEFSSDADRVRRFEQEAHTISRLNHSNIITIHDVVKATDEPGDLHFIVTELVEGQTLRERLNGSRMDWREAVVIAAQIADALNAVHIVDIIHRDIKPENVMIQAGPRVKLLDFGIAKWASVSAASGDAAQTIAGIQTRMGSTPGTLKYMSPEQVRGEQLDARTDVFSLGLVLYEMIAGRHPYAVKKDAEIIWVLQSEDEIPPVDEVIADIPAELARIVTKALRKRREKRYSSGDEMLADLERLRLLIEVGGGKKEERALRAQNADQLLTRFVVFHDADRKT